MMAERAFTEKELRFIELLEAATRETGLAIGGCGCCGSPFLDKLEEADLGEESGYAIPYRWNSSGDPAELTWVSSADSDFERDRHKIVKPKKGEKT